jgi:hypothetical protein
MSHDDHLLERLEVADRRIGRGLRREGLDLRSDASSMRWLAKNGPGGGKPS